MIFLFSQMTSPFCTTMCWHLLQVYLIAVLKCHHYHILKSLGTPVVWSPLSPTSIIFFFLLYFNFIFPFYFAFLCLFFLSLSIFSSIHPPFHVFSRYLHFYGLFLSSMFFLELFQFLIPFSKKWFCPLFPLFLMMFYSVSFKGWELHFLYVLCKNIFP